jgi:hypothetical protein
MSWWDKSQVVEMSVVEMSVALMSVGQKSRHHFTQIESFRSYLNTVVETLGFCRVVF